MNTGLNVEGLLKETVKVFEEVRGFSLEGMLKLRLLPLAGQRKIGVKPTLRQIRRIYSGRRKSTRLCL
jgi:hypothetical protein